jgi:hypothetical protein
MIRSMDMEYTIFQVILMVKDIMDNGKMVWGMDMEYIAIQMMILD